MVGIDLHVEVLALVLGRLDDVVATLSDIVVPRLIICLRSSYKGLSSSER